MDQNFEKFGKYILLEKLAMGGMAEVYLTKAPSAGGISKFIAIKRILPQFSENKEFISMFKDEAKIAINLNHSNIVSIFEFGDVGNQFYLAMDYVEGRNLRQILNKLKKSPQRLSTEQCLYIVKEVAAGLDNAHRCLDGATGRPLNIIHRDMSPQNIMISFEGEVKVVDFGIAKAESQIETTRAGTLKGKFGYMSPEQVDGLQVDLRTDIFSLGTVLWELLANDRLFVANNEINTLRKIRDCQIPSLRKINPNIPQELDRIVNKALARDRNLRYQTSAAFHKDLNRFLNRQYPDFSSQDFSVFIKTLYSNEILETRKRLIEYSKIKFNGEPMDDDRTEVTATITATRSKSEIDPLPARTAKPTKNEAALQLETTNDIDFKGLKVDKSELIRRSAEFAENRDRPLTTEIDNMSHSNYHTGTMGSTTGTGTGVASTYTSVTALGQKPRSGTFRNFLLLLIFVVGFIYYWQPDLFNASQQTDLGSEVETRRHPPKRQTAANVAETYSLLVTSTPSKAEIYVNEKNTGIVTPGRVRVPKNKVFTLEVRRPSYITFKSRYKVVKEGQRVPPITLQRELIGHLDIDVSPRTAIIYVNGEKLHKSPPIKQYAVPAGAKISVKAINPFSSTETEKIVVVERDKTKKILLKLRPKQPGAARKPSTRRQRR